MLRRAVLAAGAARWRPTPARDDVLHARPRPGHDPAGWRRRGTSGSRPGSTATRAGPGRALLLPDARDADGLPDREPVAVHARAGRYCYDTMTLVGPGHLGGGPRGGRRRGRPRPTWPGPARGVTYALCRPPGHHATPLGVRRLVLPQQRGGGGRAAAAARRRAGRGRRPGRPPRQRDPVDLLRPRRRVLRLGARRPRRRLVPARRRVSPTRRGAAPGEGRHLNRPLAPGHR